MNYMLIETLPSINPAYWCKVCDSLTVKPHIGNDHTPAFARVEEPEDVGETWWQKRANQYARDVRADNYGLLIKELAPQYDGWGDGVKFPVFLIQLPGGSDDFPLVVKAKVNESGVFVGSPGGGHVRLNILKPDIQVVST